MRGVPLELQSVRDYSGLKEIKLLCAGRPDEINWDSRLGARCSPSVPLRVNPDSVLWRDPEPEPGDRAANRLLGI